MCLLIAFKSKKTLGISGHFQCTYMYAWYVNTLGELLSFDFISYYMVHKSMNEIFMQLEFSIDKQNVYTSDKTHWAGLILRGGTNSKTAKWHYM